MSLFCMPRQVRLRLEKIQRDFLWGGEALVQKPHPCKVENDLFGEKERWFGCEKSLSNEFNPLMQVELGYAIEREALWKQVINQKYGEDDGGWRSREVSERFGVGLWKAIRKEWNYLSSRLAFQVGNGKRVRF